MSPPLKLNAIDIHVYIFDIAIALKLSEMHIITDFKALKLVDHKHIEPVTYPGNVLDRLEIDWSRPGRGN